MASSEQDGTAAATEQLGSLGESAERRKEKEAEPTPKNGTKTKVFCSACEKESDTLKRCNGCQCVWYCDKKCQNKHRKEHKKECRIIKKELDKRGGKLDLGTEEDIGPLGKLTPREECPICMQALPLHGSQHADAICCGKTLCCGCNFQHQMKSRELSLPLTCAFCRTTMPGEEALVPLRKRAKRKDPRALFILAMMYGHGQLRLPVDQVKCIDLLRQSAGLEYPPALARLGNYYHNGEMGLEQNEEEARKYFEEAAEGGDVVARHNVGCAANKNGDPVAAMRHWRLSAAGGLMKSVEALIECCFENGLLHHGDLSETVQTFYRAKSEMKSKNRDQHIEWLKRTGKYQEEYDM